MEMTERRVFMKKSKQNKVAKQAEKRGVDILLQ